ncbi:protein FAM204A isoform X2 [Grus americana]|uniref:protein FAM204A isoform X2 n=1 Tax=Grus americana TaxID=9117 RepID=UPI002408441B|nr:protein FAM204A isoform X2 [Grus americana]
MWSGLLPPGLNESDVDFSSDEGEEPHSSFAKEDAKEDTERVRLSEFQINGPESDAISEPVLLSVTDGESESQTCPSGISLNMWNKFLALQKKNHEMKTQANQGNKGRKRKRHRKEKQKKNNEMTKRYNQVNVMIRVSSWQMKTNGKNLHSTLESMIDLNHLWIAGLHKRYQMNCTWIERLLCFRDSIHACFLSGFVFYYHERQKTSYALSGLELSIEKSVAEGDIDKAEELSDRLATRELGVKIAKAAACRNFVKAKQEAEAAQEAQKKKKLAWGFEAKKRWETKSNMGYM